jgi:RNA polymerase-binding transcription factor DksA
MQEDFEVMHHPDPVDNATDLAHTARAAGVKKIQDAIKPKQYRLPDGTWPDPDCVDCGNPIGEGRLEATGSDICIECANLNEKKGRFYANR